MKFRQFCSVPTLPFHAGTCFTTPGMKAFIGYNHIFRHNRLRFRVFPLLLKISRKKRLQFYKENIRQLSRIMVDPRYRHEGLATTILKETLPLVKMPFIECVTFDPVICHCLTKCGFKCFGWDPKKQYYYYLWTQDSNNMSRLAQFVVDSEKPTKKQKHFTYLHKF